MPIKISEKNMTLNADGVTYRFPGILQHPMDIKDQKQNGLIATNSRSIKGRLQKKINDIGNNV